MHWSFPNFEESVPASFLFNKSYFRSCLVPFHVIALSFLPRSFSVPFAFLFPFLFPFLSKTFCLLFKKTRNFVTFSTKKGLKFAKTSNDILRRFFFSNCDKNSRNFCQIYYERNEKRNEFVPFFVPQILPFRSCLVPFENDGFRSCLVPRKKERVHERVPFGTRSSNALPNR